MRGFLISALLVSAIAIQGLSFQAPSPHAVGSPAPTNIAGRWSVRFTFAGGVEKNLIFEAKAKGAGSFLFLDTGPDDKPVADPEPAAWSQLTNDRVSFSGEGEMPIGTCCREIGTLIFKGKFTSSNSLSGKLIFVTGVEDEESAFQFRSVVGTFTATRLR